MEGQYIRGPRNGVGVYEGGGNTESGTDWIGTINSVVGFLNAAGPQGAAIAAGIRTVLNFFSGGPSEWDGAGEGVHAWYTANGEEDLKAWCRAKYPDSFGHVDDAKAMRMQWIFQGAPAQAGGFLVAEKGTIQGLTEPRYMLSTMQKANEFWAKLGVNLPATITNRQANNGGLNWIPPGQIITIPGFIAGINEDIDETIDAIGNGDALTPEEEEIALALLEESDKKESQDTVFTLLGAAAAVATLSR